MNHADLDPVSLIVNDDLGNALDRAGRWPEAVEQYRKTISLDRNWPTGWSDLAFALLEVGEYREALEARLVWTGLKGRDEVIERESFEAIIRYYQTGEPQSYWRASIVLPAVRL